MPASSIALKTVPTSYAVTGGTSLPLSLLKNDFDNILLYPTADTVLASRRSIEIDFNSVKASVTSPDGYTQQRSKTFVKKPKLLANGKYTTNTGRLEFAFSVESTDADKTALLDDIAQLCIDANFRAAILKGSTT